MNTIYKREIPLLVTVLLPLVYLKYVWNSLPVKVPIHWNIHGEVDGWTDKQGLFFTVLFLLVLSYLGWLAIQKFGSKKWVLQLGNKFYQLRFIFSIFISLLCLYIIYSSGTASANINFISLLVGALIAVLGNYMHSIKPNYFIGVRTPWTLKNETVWKKTHQFSSKLLLVGGLCIILLSLFQKQHNFISFLVVVFIIALVPIIYSYTVYKQLKKA